MILFLLGVFGAALGIGGVSAVHHAENSAAKEASRRLGPHSKVRVHIKLSGIASVRGDLARVEVIAKDFSFDGVPFTVDPRLPGTGRVKELHIRLEHGTSSGFGLDLLDAKIPECRYDFHAASKGHGFQLSDCGVGTFHVELSEATMVQAAMVRKPGLRDLQIHLNAQGLHFSAVSKSLLGESRIDVVGTVVVRDGHLLALTDPVMQLNGKQVNSETATSLLTGFNPILDTEKDLGTPGVFTLGRAETRQGILVLEGAIRLPRVSSPAFAWVSSLGWAH